ncbi:biotin synthase BioB [Campylobacter corcagiensis]|uniref:biotin synthase BioB n=1 Tax=Campylobacter corcagiensis TaxID=1448857 RepID=UPI0004B1E3C1|nr:biotin synthase BioB [Campylobacter corcagiensis]QKF64249.1 biotin synthetase [Campylobacter corcagiensis]
MVNIIKDKVLNGYKITKDEALNLAKESNLDELLSAADEIRSKFCGCKFNLCSIINVKSGRCSQDCSYCAQSAHFSTGCDEYDIKQKDEVLKFAKQNELENTHRFSLVASGRGLKSQSKDLVKYTEIYHGLKEGTNLHLCGSFGLMDEDALVKLKNLGVQTYHHNLETSRKHYPKICTTHTYDDRINTIKNAKKAGLDVCSGGIFGLGESLEDRVDMAIDLRDLGVTSVPINILTPIKGTPLENSKPLEHEEILRSIAIYRFILPDVYLRFAGGRNFLTKSEIKKALHGGINSLLTGNFLTTAGDCIASDKVLAKEAGFDLSKGADV